jgi:hypothetical protein
MLQALTQYSIMWSRSVTVLYTVRQKVVSKCHLFPHIVPKMIRSPYKLPHDNQASLQDIVILSLVSVKPKLVAAYVYTTEVETILTKADGFHAGKRSR